MRERLFLSISRGPNARTARPLLVSDDEDFVRAVGFELAAQLGHDPERVAARLNLEGEGARIVPIRAAGEPVAELRYRGSVVVATTGELAGEYLGPVKKAPPRHAGLPDRRVAELTAAPHGARVVHATTDPETVTAFCRACLESDEPTPAERQILAEVIAACREVAALEASDRKKLDALAGARKAADAASEAAEHAKVRFKRYRGFHAAGDIDDEQLAVVEREANEAEQRAAAAGRVAWKAAVVVERLKAEAEREGTDGA